MTEKFQPKKEPQPSEPEMSQELHEAIKARQVKKEKPEETYETTSVEGETYDVGKIEQYAETLPIQEVEIEKVKEAVGAGHKYWVDRKGEMFGPAELLEDWASALKNSDWADHITTILLSNKDNPIWVWKETGLVFNGMHRLTKAVLDGDETIKARIFESLPDNAKLETSSNEQVESAREILGERQFLGPEDIEAAFGVKITEIPDMQFSNERLQQAKEQGELLVLRFDASSTRVPFTIQNLLKHQKSKDKRLFSSIASDMRDEEFLGQEDFWQEAMPFLDETPQLEWVLVKTEPVTGTEHLSQNLQEALMSKAPDGELARLLAEQKAYWEEIWLDPDKDGYNPEIYDEAVKKIPSMDELKEIRDSLPEGASLPTAIEVIYDQLLYASKNGKPLYDDMTVATKTSVSEIDDEPVRPIDIAMLDADMGINLHMRRSMKMGRPASLGNLKAGVPIGHINLSK